MRFFQRLVLREDIYEPLAHVVSVLEEQLPTAIAQAQNVEDPRVAVELSQASSPRAVVEAAPSRQ